MGEWLHGPELRSAADWTEIAARAGLVPINVRDLRMHDTYATVNAFLKGIRMSGANNAAPQSDVCRRPSVVRRMMAVYQERFATEGGVYATWEWVRLSATKTPSAQAATG